jgi:hypothetical protein
MSESRLDESNDVQTGVENRCSPGDGLVTCRGDADASKRNKFGLAT